MYRQAPSQIDPAQSKEVLHNAMFFNLPAENKYGHQLSPGTCKATAESNAGACISNVIAVFARREAKIHADLFRITQGTGWIFGRGAGHATGSRSHIS